MTGLSAAWGAVAATLGLVPGWLLVLLLVLSPVLLGVGVGLVLVIRFARFVPAVTDLRVAQGQALLCRVAAGVDDETLYKIGLIAERSFRAKGVVVPVLVVGNGTTWAVVGERTAASGQQVPA